MPSYTLRSNTNSYFYYVLDRPDVGGRGAAAARIATEAIEGAGGGGGAPGAGKTLESEQFNSSSSFLFVA